MGFILFLNFFRLSPHKNAPNFIHILSPPKLPHNQIILRFPPGPLQPERGLEKCQKSGNHGVIRTKHFPSCRYQSDIHSPIFPIFLAPLNPPEKEPPEMHLTQDVTVGLKSPKRAERVALTAFFFVSEYTYPGPHQLSARTTSISRL